VTDQLQLFAGVREADVHELLALLRARGGWLTRRQIAPLLGWNHRKIRSVAEAAPDDIIRGPKGYAPLDRVDLDALSLCAGRLESQARKMLACACAWRRRAHAKLG